MPAPSEPARPTICVTGLRGIPGVMGGVETHCEQIYGRVAEMDPSLDIVILGRRGYIPGGRHNWHGIDVQALPAIRNKYLEAILHTAIAVLHASFRERADVLHLHAIGPSLFCPLARLLGLRVVATHHGHDYARPKWGPLAKAVLRLGEICAVMGAHRVVTVSENSRDTLRARFPSRADRIQWIPNGASLPSPERSAEEILQPFGLSPGRFVLGVGRLDSSKRFGDLIDAHAGVEGAPPILIAGDADHADAYSRDLRARGSDRVIFAGRLSLPDLAALYRACSVFVLPSAHEGLPISALEALSAGCPVILSDIPANRELKLPEACYFGVGDVERLAAMLTQGAQRGGYDDFRPSDAALLAPYDWDEIARQTHALLLDLLARDRRPGSGSA